MRKPKHRSTRTRWIVGMIGAVVVMMLVGRFLTKKEVRESIHTRYGAADPAFQASLGGLGGYTPVGGNSVVSLVNGDEIFPAMLASIRSARRSITFETYIWETGETGSLFRDALMERASNGVPVLVIVDGMGTLKLKQEDMEAMKQAGVKFVKFGRDRWYKIKPNINHRTHRKDMVVDGRVGFCGGVCIADTWLGNAQDHTHWRDTHYRIEGPAVQQLQGVFAENWLQTTGKVLQGPEFFPPELPAPGKSIVQFVKSGPSDGEESTRLVHLLAIAAARQSIRLSHAYFVPDNLAIKALLEARARGVAVEVIVPGKNDSTYGRAASRSRWGELMEAGVEFYEYKKALYHCKAMIVDDAWVTAGSVNFDDRSFQINDECNFNTWDPEFAAAQVRQFEADKSDSRRIDPREFAQRSWCLKAADWIAGLARSQL